MAGFSTQRPNQPITRINVTPLVDITLVLLIIFMLTAKLVVSRALPFDLPAAASGDDVQEIFSLSLTAAGETVLDGQTLPNSPALLRRAKSALAANPQLRAVLRADGRVPHARVLHCMDVLRQAGITRIAFAVAPGAEVDEVEDQPAGAEPPGYVWPKRE